MPIRWYLRFLLPLEIFFELNSNITHTFCTPFSLDKASITFVRTPSATACFFSSLYKSRPLFLHPKNKYMGPYSCWFCSIFICCLRWLQKPRNGAIPDPGPTSMCGAVMSLGMWKPGALKRIKRLIKYLLSKVLSAYCLRWYFWRLTVL